MQRVTALRLLTPDTQVKYVDLTYVRLVIDRVKEVQFVVTIEFSSVFNVSTLGTFEFNE